MDIEKYNKAQAHLEHIGVLAKALSIEGSVFEMSDEEICKKTLNLSGGLHDACQVCHKEISEVIRKRLIQEINEFREL